MIQTYLIVDGRISRYSDSSELASMEGEIHGGRDDKDTLTKEMTKSIK